MVFKALQELRSEIAPVTVLIAGKLNGVLHVVEVQVPERLGRKGDHSIIEKRCFTKATDMSDCKPGRRVLERNVQLSRFEMLGHNRS